MPWSIEEERRTAEDFALRAAISEDAGMPHQAYFFRELVALCDKKVEILQRLHDAALTLALARPAPFGRRDKY